MVCNEHGEALFGNDGLFSDIIGQSLVTGYSDTDGVVYLRQRTHSGDDVAKEIEWESDGMRWESPDPSDLDGESSYGGYTMLCGVLFPSDKADEWLQQQTSAEDAYQALLTGLDVYIPGLVFVRDPTLSNVGRLGANGHVDCLSNEFIRRIDVIRFGSLKEFSDSEAASRQLEAAVGRVDLDVVRSALSSGATTGRLPESRHTALWLSLNEASGYDAKNRPVTFDVVSELLTSGANPNDLADRAASPVEQLIAIDFVQTRGKTKKAKANRLNTLVLLDDLIKSGLDVNAILYGRYAYGYRPLHAASLHNQPEMVRRLLEAGADRTLANDREVSSWECLFEHFKLLATDFNKKQKVPVEESVKLYAEVLALLGPAP